MSPEKIYSPDIALKAADAFRSHSQIFIGSLGNSLDRAAQHAAQNLGDFIASATMLSLALELYLKALRATINITIPETHDLWALYKKLPQELKKSIECSYTKINSNNEEKLAGLELAIWVGRQPPIDDPPEVNKEKEKTDSYNDFSQYCLDLAMHFKRGVIFTKWVKKTAMYYLSMNFIDLA